VPALAAAVARALGTEAATMPYSGSCPGEPRSRLAAGLQCYTIFIGARFRASKWPNSGAATGIAVVLLLLLLPRCATVPHSAHLLRSPSAPPTEQDREARALAAERVCGCAQGCALCPHAHHHRMQGSTTCCVTHTAAAPALTQAEARQRQFEQSAVGRAALKAAKDAKKPEVRPGGSSGNAQDWLT
jgi:hypothetical protein